MNLVNNVPFNNWTIITASKISKIAGDSDNHGTPPQKTRPIHGLQSQVRTDGWEEAEHHNDRDPTESENVAKNTKWSPQGPWPIMDGGWVEDLFVQYQNHWQGIT